MRRNELIIRVTGAVNTSGSSIVNPCFGLVPFEQRRIDLLLLWCDSHKEL
jgi:hypothetical protein